MAYADDKAIIVERQSRVEIRRRGTEWMRIVSKRDEYVRVGMSEGRTMTMLMKAIMVESRRPCFRKGAKLNMYEEIVKYLGVREG